MMRTSKGLLLVLCLGAASPPIQAEIYKCREVTGSILYTDTPCDAEAETETIAIMPTNGTHFESPALSDAAVEENLRLLSEQEDELTDEINQAQAAPGESLRTAPEAHALRVQILAALKSVRQQKRALLGRGLSTQDGEELVVVPDK